MLVIFFMCFVRDSIHAQWRRRTVVTSGSSGCETSSVISLQLGYLLIFLYTLHSTGWLETLTH